MRRIGVYCSGSIAKGTSDTKKLCWTIRERQQVSRGAEPIDIVYLNPDDPIPDVGNTLGQFGRDMFQILTADVVIVDGRERRGIGIGVEMAAAAAMGTPTVIIAPANSQYRSDELQYRGVTVRNYVHPHVSALASVIVDTFEEAGSALADAVARNRGERHVPDWLTAAISEYKENVLARDTPMLVALKNLSRCS
jgi:hypothetical protein